MIFSSVIVSFIVCLMAQSIPSVPIPPGISREFVQKTSGQLTTGKGAERTKRNLPVPNLLLCPWSSQSDLRAASSTDAPVLLLNQPISHKTVSTQHGDVIPPNLIGSWSNNDLVSTILRRLNTVCVMISLGFLKKLLVFHFQTGKTKTFIILRSFQTWQNSRPCEQRNKPCQSCLASWIWTKMD